MTRTVGQSSRVSESVEPMSTWKVGFVVVRRSGNEGELRAAIGVPPDLGRSGVNRRHDEAWWEIGQEGSGSDDLSALISSVLPQVGDLKEQLVQVCSAADPTCLLRVVQ